MTVHRSVILSLLFVLSIGCDRNTQAPATAPAQPAQTPPPILAGSLQCDIAVVAPVLPKRITHLTIDPASNLYFLQEADDGSDTLFIVGNGDVSNAIPLSAHGVLTVLEEKGSGNIQSIAAGSDGNVYFYFSGGTNKKLVACLGRFETRTGLIRILARETELADKSGMGPSLALCAGSLVAAGRTLWLWLHHTDASAMFNVRIGEIPAEGEMSLPTPTRLYSSDGTLNMTHGELALSPGPGDLTLLLDTWTAALEDRSQRQGRCGAVAGWLTENDQRSGADAQGDILMFAAESESIEPRVDQRVAPVNIETHYPSLLVLQNGTITPIPRDDLHAAAGVPLSSMQIDQLLCEPGRNSWIGYDAASGQIVRLRRVAEARELKPAIRIGVFGSAA